MTEDKGEFPETQAETEEKPSSVHLSPEAEFQAYLNAFSSSSSRVRWTLGTILITCLLIFIGYWNSREHSWIAARINLAKIALENKVWENQEEEPESGAIKLAREWVIDSGYKSKEELDHVLEKLREHRTEHVLLVRSPFLGFVFDVNDLGILGGIALSTLMLILAACMARQHENLFLGLRKVKKISLLEGRSFKDSTANVLYHGMAMVEVFTKPPTLARWSTRGLRWSYQLIFLIPISVQMLIFWYDMRTVEKALQLTREATGVGILIQVGAILFILAMTMVCLAYTRASNVRWRNTFFVINPNWKDESQPSWWTWMQLHPKSKNLWFWIVIAAGVCALLLLSLQRVLEFWYW